MGKFLVGETRTLYFSIVRFGEPAVVGGGRVTKSIA